MPTSIVNYVLDSSQVSNPDGTLPINLGSAEIQTTFPVVVDGVTYHEALNTTGDSQGASVDISTVQGIDPVRFHAQVVFYFESGVDGIQNLIQSDRLPFALSVAGADGKTTITASVKSQTIGWRATEIYPSPFVNPFKWHYADLVYDVDTLAVFLDGKLASLHGFGPESYVDLLPTGSFTIGGGTGTNAFSGLIAAVKLDAGIPVELETKLDLYRVTAQWYITTKLETLRPIFDMGNPLSAPVIDTGSGVWTQEYDRGLIVFCSGAGSAFEIHGPILDRYRAIQDAQDILGYLCSDIVPSGDPGDPASLAATFSKGAIYIRGGPISDRFSAVEVVGRIYFDYMIDDGPKATGIPLLIAFAIDGGLLQIMSGASWMWKSGALTSFLVQGAIRDAYQTSGGWLTWGFPTSNETDIQISGQTRSMKMSMFELCTFYWSQSTGAHWVRGDILTKYNDLGGPGALGLPITDELDIPGTPNGKMSSFENCIICWFGSFESIKIARPFYFYLGTINTVESEGFLMGQNDVYVNISIRENGVYLVNRRYPDSGDSDGHNIWNPNFTFNQLLVPKVGTRFDIVVQILDADPGDDDLLGTWRKPLDASNAWGFADSDGIWNSGPFEKINNLIASAKADIDPSSIVEKTNWWGWRDPQNSKSSNLSTERISRNAFAEAFPSVDSEPEWWDILDGLDSIFYEIAIAGCAKGGNCVGLSLEAAYSRGGRTPFALPLSQYTDWPAAERSINVKHTYQYGAQALWWYVSQVLSGNMHNPVDVFNNSESSAIVGKFPLINFIENWTFTGKGHTVLPIAWDATTNPWKISVHDPNWPGEYGTRVITIDPEANWFVYQFDNTTTFSGGQAFWDSSRMYYNDMDIYGNGPRVPTFDLIALIVAGVVICCGDQVTTTSMLDQHGRNLDGTSDNASGKDLTGYFVPLPVSSAIGDAPRPQTLLSGQLMKFTQKAPSIPPQEFLRRLQLLADNAQSGDQDQSLVTGSGFEKLMKGQSWANQNEEEQPNLHAATCERKHHPQGECSCQCEDNDSQCKTPPGSHGGSSGESPSGNSPPPPTATTPLLASEASPPSKSNTNSQPTSSIHTITGTTRGGKLIYYSKSTLTRFELSNGTISDEESLQVHAIDIGTANGHYILHLDREKEFTLRVSQRQGLTSSALSIELSLRTVEAGRLRISAVPGLFILDVVPSHDHMIKSGSAVVRAHSKGGWSSQNIDLGSDFGPGGIRFKTCPGLVGKMVTVARLGHGGRVLASNIKEGPAPPH